MPAFPNIPETVKKRFEPFEIHADGRRVEGFPACADRIALPDLVKIYTEATGIKAFLEVGSWAGTTACLMAYDNPDVTIYCVDTWKGSATDMTGIVAREIGQRGMFKQFCKNIGELLYKQVVPCVGSSETYAAIWPFKLAGVFIDADHAYDACYKNMEEWYPHVAEGGVFCGHDYNTFPAVGNAVDDFAKEYGLPDAQVHGDVWWFVKPCQNQN